MNKAKQMSETIRLGAILAISGGFMDAYSYICRGEVFANAQTGNILLFGVHLTKGEFSYAIRYALPVAAFITGIAIADCVRYRFKNYRYFHWRQVIVLCEAMILTLVMFMPQEYNLLANTLTSLACGAQVETFRKVWGRGIATTMCIGNIRIATQSVCEYAHKKNKTALLEGIGYYGVVGVFVAGAVLGNKCVELLEEKAICVSAALLIAAFALMLRNGEK